MGAVDLHAHRRSARWSIDEQPRGATPDVAAVDVAGDEVTGVERRTTAGRDPFRRARAGQHDDWGSLWRCGARDLDR
jgi:hypothetical protein